MTEIDNLLLEALTSFQNEYTRDIEELHQFMGDYKILIDDLTRHRQVVSLGKEVQGYTNQVETLSGQLSKG